MDEEPMKLGLLLEAAHSQQILAETTLEKLKAHAQGLDDVVREAVRSTLVEQVQLLGNDTHRAEEALRRLARSANLRTAFWSVGITTLCSVIPLGEAWWVLPSRAELAALSAKRDELAATIVHLEQQGGRMDLRRCGARLCVRVDRKAPVYGDAGDYFVVRGY